MRAQRKSKRLEIFDSLKLVKQAHGRKMLKAMGKFLDEDMLDWEIVMYTNVPQQSDGKSCDVFACVIAKHLVEDAAMPKISAAIADWRCWLARALMRGAAS